MPVCHAICTLFPRAPERVFTPGAGTTRSDRPAGESRLSFLSQMLVISGQSFLSATVGLAAGVAVVRGLTRRDGGVELATSGVTAGHTG